MKESRASTTTGEKEEDGAVEVGDVHALPDDPFILLIL